MAPTEAAPVAISTEDAAAVVSTADAAAAASVTAATDLAQPSVTEGVPVANPISAATAAAVDGPLFTALTTYTSTYAAHDAHCSSLSPLGSHG
jgi:hypothetical protein